MLQIRRAAERGAANLGWLDSRHTFSFSDYYDPQHMGFGPLRVINEDRVQPGKGFGTHAHRDMEIISYVLEGALGHKDSLGNGSVIRPGDVQRMSAGTGVRHSEFNESESELVHFMQIWIVPERTGEPPSYEERRFADAEKRNQLKLIGSRDGRDGSVVIHQHVDLYTALLAAGDEVVHHGAADRKLWLQIVRGAVVVNNEKLSPGDGAAITGEAQVTIRGASESEVLLFDMA